MNIPLFEDLQNPKIIFMRYRTHPLKIRHFHFITLSVFLFTLFIQAAFSQEITRKDANFLLFRLRQPSNDVTRLNILTNLAWFQVLKAGKSKTDLDSAKFYLAQAEVVLRRLNSPESKGFFYLVYADYWKENGQKEFCQIALDKAIRYLKTGKDSYHLGCAYEERMFSYPINPATNPEKIHLLQMAAVAFRSAGNKRKLGDCLRLEADLRTFTAYDEMALPELDSAKQLYQEAKSGDWQQIYILYSRFYMLQDNYGKSLEAILNALRATDVSDRSPEVCELDLQASLLYYNLKQYKQSLLYGKSSLEIARKMTDTIEIYEIAQFIIKIYAEIGTMQPGLSLISELEARYPVEKFDQVNEFHLLARLNIHDHLKQYKKGQVYFDKINKMINQKLITNEYHLVNCLYVMSEFCIGSGQYAQAVELLNHWELAAEKIKPALQAREKILRIWLQLDTTRKNYKAAAHDWLQLDAVRDSIFNEAQARQLKNLEVEYQTERKENENILQRQRIQTLTQQQQLELAEVKNITTTRNITLLSAFCAVLIAGLLYRQFSQSRKNSKIIEGKNKGLERLLKENDWLLKEVHHRVKNNLQIIIALLNSQSAFLQDGAALDAIMKSKGRVESIALIHQKLYKANNYSSIYMPEYIQELINYLKISFLDGQSIWFDLSIDPVRIDVSDAVPLGLIINEGVTNAIKHAFVNACNNTILIELQKRECELTLTVRDNGKGFTTGDKNDSFGLLLMNGLAEELGGELEMLNDDGTIIRVSYKPVHEVITEPVLHV
jgi:two-component system, sensor histidine kinase PdtaS